jgi:hypothetical protein
MSMRPWGWTLMRRLSVAWILASVASAKGQEASADSLSIRKGMGPQLPIASAARSMPKAPPAGPPKVAVLPFVGEDIDADKLSELTARFQSELASTDSFRITPKREVDAGLRASLSKDSSACGDNDCSLEIGRRLGVQSVFTGVVSQEVETWRLEVSRTDVQSGKTTFDHLIEIYGTFGDLAGRGCYRMARIASGRESSENNYTVLDGGGGGNVWPWVVGGIAVAAGGATAAVLFLANGGSTPTTTTPSPDRLIVKW